MEFIKFQAHSPFVMLCVSLILLDFRPKPVLSISWMKNLLCQGLCMLYYKVCALRTFGFKVKMS